MSTRDVNLIGQCSGQAAIDWPVIRRERPGGSIRADTVNTERRRVDRSLTNGHQPTETRPLTHRLPAIPYCQAGVWVKGCGVWWYRSLDETHWGRRGNCIGRQVYNQAESDFFRTRCTLRGRHSNGHVLNRLVSLQAFFFFCSLSVYLYFTLCFTPLRYSGSICLESAKI